MIPDPLPAFELPWHDYPPGTTTDDTGMARNLIRSLVHAGDVDTVDLADRHIEWYRSQPAGIGNLTRRVLERADRTGVLAELAARQLWEQRGPEVSAGNGSVMYCAPLGAFRATRPDLLFEEAPALSAITHWDERCRTACLAVTLAVAALVRGEGHRESVERGVEAVIGRREERSSSTWLPRQVTPGRSMGRIWASRCSPRGSGSRWPPMGPSFEEGLRYVVSLGGDTDTNAAVTGALLGALHGREALPSAWLEKLEDRQAIEAEAEALADAATA